MSKNEWKIRYGLLLFTAVMLWSFALLCRAGIVHAAFVEEEEMMAPSVPGSAQSPAAADGGNAKESAAGQKAPAKETDASRNSQKSASKKTAGNGQNAPKTKYGSGKDADNAAAADTNKNSGRETAAGFSTPLDRESDVETDGQTGGEIVSKSAAKTESAGQTEEIAEPIEKTETTEIFGFDETKLPDPKVSAGSRDGERRTAQHLPVGGLITAGFFLLAAGICRTVVLIRKDTKKDSEKDIEKDIA